MNPKKPNPGKSLAELNPTLAKEWHQTMNGNLTSKDVTCNSNKKVWWKCPEGGDHEWKTTVAHRNNGKGCPVCSGHKVAKSTSIATLKPDLSKEWHPAKNGHLTPNDVSPGSGRKVWWKCPKGDDHEWQTSVRNRRKGDGCPICSNRKVVKSNSLATLNPVLTNEWHPWKNGALTPMDVTPGSNRKVWWQNHLGREWQALICQRVIQVRNRIDPDQLALFEDEE